DLAGHAWRWEDGRLAGGSMLSRLLAQPAGLTLLGLGDGLLALWLAVALVSWRRQGRYRVFISYRRGDTAGHAGRLRDSLEEVLGQNAVFLDLSNLAPGTPFAPALEGRIRAAECMLVVIGRDWLTARDEAGLRRLDDAGDWVRREIEIGLARNKRLIPVLVAGADMPDEAMLPTTLRPLAGLQAFVIEEAHFQRDAEALAEALDAPAAPAAAADRTLSPARSRE
ncbi:MAG: toll/interleukin-1 receptor domain-containing protein, partial [Zoogloeaceae bacterium]|nr:toll/interleukin-1 receptor domain-containing protein [Zoogloeaceae bacterium]